MDQEIETAKYTKYTKEFVKMETIFKTDGSTQVGVQASAWLRRWI
jgi:hypothetical protein